VHPGGFLSAWTNNRPYSAGRLSFSNRSDTIFPEPGGAFMTLSKRAAVCVALVFVLNLFSAMAFGEIWEYGTPYTDGSSTIWKGTSPFAHPTSGLMGDIDWIVYGPGQFPYEDSGYHPPSDQFTYAYQIENTGTPAISDFTLSVDQVIANIGSFVSPGRVEGDLPAYNIFVSGPGGTVDWGFDGIDKGYASAGLVFTSLKAPMTTTGQVTNGGSAVGVTSLPGPGPNDIPEPGTLMLLLAGLGFVAIVRCFPRR
jgi:hypothetical protein